MAQTTTKSSKSISKTPENVNASIFTFRRQFPIVLFSIFMLIAVSLYYVPSEIDPINFELPDLVTLSDRLSFNNYLNLSHLIYERQIFGPESLAFYESLCMLFYTKDLDKIYTGTHDGKIMELHEDIARLYTRIGPENCNSLMLCGRPLGIRVDPYNPRLIVADAYLGLYAISLNNPNNITKLFPTPEIGIDFKPTFFNDVEIVSDGVFVVSESSTKLPYHKLMNIILEGSSTGKIYLVNTKDKTFQTIASNLAFPNGLQILDNKKTLLVAETLRNRILTLNLDSLKLGYLTDKIPGMPDNIRKSPMGGYWVGLAATSYKDSPGFYYYLRNWPYIRWAAHKLIPAPMLHSFGLYNKHVIVVRISEDGVIQESLQGIEVPGLGAAEVLELKNGTMYFSSYYLPHLRRLDRSSINKKLDASNSA